MAKFGFPPLTHICKDVGLRLLTHSQKRTSIAKNSTVIALNGHSHPCLPTKSKADGSFRETSHSAAMFLLGCDTNST